MIGIVMRLLRETACGAARWHWLPTVMRMFFTVSTGTCGYAHSQNDMYEIGARNGGERAV